MVKPLIAIAGMTLTLMFASAFSSGETLNQYPLHAAAQQDDVTRIEQLLSSSSKIDARDQSGSTALLVAARANRSEEHTSELQSLMRISYAVFCLTKKNIQHSNTVPPSRSHHYQHYTHSNIPSTHLRSSHTDTHPL